MAMPPPSGALHPQAARFVTGSIMRHVTVMALTSAIGLVAVFGVDLLNFFYISLLGQKPIAAAVGFAGAVGFFQISICIGLTIGVGATVSAAIGAQRLTDARRVGTISLIAMAAVALVLGIATALAREPLLGLLRAEGDTRALAANYLAITSPSLPLLAIGMGSAALLRSIGAAKRSMNVTLFAAVAVAFLDPLLIFGLHLGLTGAAISAVLSRVILAGLGLTYVLRQDLLGPPEFRQAATDLRRVGRVAGPAILTNLATPVSAAYATHAMAGFGVAAVAGQATIDRITPVAFGVIFALTGAVGPIMAQNLGAGRPDRVRETLRAALTFMITAVLIAWAVLAATQHLLALAFDSHGVAADLLHLFCTWVAGSLLFAGALFVANAAFNNLGRPGLATLFNWGRATLGTIPFVHYGMRYGAEGVLIGQALGSVVFGLGAVIVAFGVVRHLRAPFRAETPNATIAVPTARGALASLLVQPEE
jgi:putative MATE family efflux protein